MAFGIDFGTTNSAVVYENRILDTGGGRPFPSIVAVHPVDGKVICGPDAKDMRQRLVDAGFHVVRSVKRMLESDRTWLVQGRVWRAADFARELFKALRKHAGASGNTDGHDLDSAVVSIPVNWPAARRRVLRRAAAEGGVSVTSFVSEPTAAYLRCRHDMPPCQRVAVFDWGGGTLDVAVLATEDHRVRELGTAMNEEAGDAIDLGMARWCHGRLTEGEVAAPSFDDMPAADQESLIVECEGAKVDLSGVPKRDITLRSYGGRTDIPQIGVTREDLRRVSAPFVDRAVHTLEMGLARAGVKADEVDVFLVVGGSSRLASLQERLGSLYGRSRIFNTQTPDWDVAEGAAIVSHSGIRPVLLQRVQLALADGESLELVGPGAVFDGRIRPFTLGVVEAAEAASLVFTESRDADGGSTRPRFIKALSVPTMGLHLEPVLLDVRLTEDLTMAVSSRSRHGNEQDKVEWEYEGLRFAFDVAP